jgi:hypothetical protein
LSLRTLSLSATSRAMKAMVFSTGGIVALFDDFENLGGCSRSCKSCNVMVS